MFHSLGPNASPEGGRGGDMQPLEMEQNGDVRRSGASGKTKRLLWGGSVLAILGCLLVIMAVLISEKGGDYRTHQIKRTLVVDSSKHPEFKAWLGSSTSSKTPMYHSYHFYNLTNADAFLQGQPPVVAEVGPFTFEEDNRKFNVTFSDGGKLVSYVTLYQYKYQGDEADLEQMIYTINVPYAAAVMTTGSEENMLTTGAQQALPQIREQLSEYFVPTLMENAVVQAIKKSTEGAAPLNTLTDADAVIKLWGGRCISVLFGVLKFCGFNMFEKIAETFALAPKLDIALMKVALNTGLDKDPLSNDQVLALWDEKDPYAMLNTDRFNASIRYGISRWVSDNATAHTEIKQRFKLSEKQFKALKTYVMAIHSSELLEKRAVKTFNDAIPPADRASAKITKWNDFVMRQFLVGDVIGRLQADEGAAPKFESVQPENPPELGFYAESQGVKTFEYGAGVLRFSRAQGDCIFGLGDLPQATFQTNVSGLPPPRIDRPQFVDFGLNNTVTEWQGCFPEKKEMELLHGYFGYLGTHFVADEFKKSVIESNGGMVNLRSIRELIVGHVSPILKLSLAPDDPRAKGFGFMVNDTSLYGPARCASAADVDNPFNACVLKGWEDGVNEDGKPLVMRVFDKVPHTFHTGKDDTARLGAFHAFHGDTMIQDIWPGGSFPLEGAMQGQKRSIQYGYSDGQQFPPFNSIEREASPRLSIFVPNFVLPLHFDYQKDVVTRGIKLKRFVLSEETFSSSRPDAKVFDMTGIKQQGLLNMTGLLSATTYLTRPHHRATAPYDMADIKGMRPYDEEMDQSYLDVEPVTGKTMSARIQLQLSVGLDSQGAYSVFHKNMYPAKAMPVMYLKQHAEVSGADAAFFKKSIYDSEKGLTAGAATTGALGGAALIGGMTLLILYYAWRRRGEEEKKGGSGSDSDEEAKAASADEVNV